MIVLVMLGSCLAIVGVAMAQETTSTLVDRVVAVVNDEPILASEVDRALRLGMTVTEPAADPTGRERRALDDLVDQRLRFQEVERYGFERVPASAVELQMKAVVSRFESREAFEERLAEAGMDLDGLRQLLARQLQVVVYVEELLGARVFVGLEEITDYYQTVLMPRARATGEELPALAEVREQIRTVLREERLNQELEQWTAGLRAEADIVDYLDRVERPLPPLVETVDADRPAAAASDS